MNLNRQSYISPLSVRQYSLLKKDKIKHIVHFQASAEKHSKYSSLKMGKMRGIRSFLRKERIKTYVTEAKNKYDKADCLFSAN